MNESKPELKDAEAKKSTAKQTAKKIWNVVSTILVILVVALAVVLVGARLMGMRVFNVISGSMVPTYNVGDLIYVKPVEPEQVQVGDVITFVLNEDLVVATHRVVKIDAEHSRFYTKGDANKDPDADPVHFKNLIGKPLFRIPLMGYVSDWIQHPPGLYISIVAGVLLLVAVFVPDLIDAQVKKTLAQTAQPPQPAQIPDPKPDSDPDKPL